jgi:glycosyltransferase involved in cell wall biosynthesis
MKNILLFNKNKIPHYRVPVYNYLSDYLIKYGFILTIVSEGVQEGNPHTIRFPYRKRHLGFTNVARLLTNLKPHAAIFWVNPQLYMIPVLFLAKLLKIKVIHWGHRRPQRPNVFIKTLYLNFIEHWIDDAVIIYAEHLRKYVCNCFQSKTFVANNTLNLTTYKQFSRSNETLKSKYGISTGTNIICMGRMDRRKRIDDLIEAFRILNMPEVGLILVGPDSEGNLKNIAGRNIFKLGPVYGEESLDLLSVSDVYCLPGSIGLSIIDAFYCGLPVVTERVFHGPEIMYLKDGINGFMVPKGDIEQLTAKLKMLLLDDALRKRFSQAAKNEIMTSGNIDRMCEGFLNALQYVFK